MDEIFEAFLAAQYDEAMAVVARSPILELLCLPGRLPSRFLASFACRGLVREPSGEVAIAEHFTVALRFPPDYLRRVHPAEIVTFVEPHNVFHPNIAVGPTGFGLMCLGRVAPATRLLDLLEQIYEIITCAKITMREDDCLNPEACSWARRHQDLFPLDTRSLRGPGSDFTCIPIGEDVR